MTRWHATPVREPGDDPWHDVAAIALGITVLMLCYWWAS